MESLKKVFQGIDVIIHGTKEIKLKGVTANSKQVSPGFLYIAKKGQSFDGAKFIPEAIAAGAIAVVSDLYDPFLKGVVQIIHPNPVEIEQLVVNRVYDFPAEKLKIIGITGTNGKTTTSYIIKHLLDPNCGLIGTIEWVVGGKVLPSTHTTPDFATLTKLFYDMERSRCQYVSMEVSSHALEQGRVKGIAFDTAIFTNLTLDHLDYHKTMENYAAAKAKLFKESKTVIVNCDDPYHRVMIPGCTERVIRYGFSSDADLRASHVELSPTGMQFHLYYAGKEYIAKSLLIGRFNVYNILAAVAAALVQGRSLEEILQKLGLFTGAPGRLQRVMRSSKGPHIFVDYAHTDDALKNVLQMLQELKRGRVITVFGCGGDRDTFKRPKMAQAAASLSDFVVITSDNPRSEDPLSIIQQTLPGFADAGRYLIEVDRKEAIQKAIAMADPDDIVLIAGKGHEKVQIFAHKTIPFDDVEIAMTYSCSA